MIQLPGTAGLPPGIARRELGTPFAEGHPGLGPGPGIGGPGVEHQAVDADAEDPVRDDFQAVGIILPGVERPAGEALGVDLAAAQLVGQVGHLVDAASAPVGRVGPELPAQDEILVLHGNLLRVKRFSVRLDQQAHAGGLLHQLGHISVIVLGEQVFDRGLPVGEELPAALRILHRPSGQHGQPLAQRIAAPGFELLLHQRSPALTLLFVAVYLEIHQGLPGQFAGQRQDHRRIAVPEALHGLTAHLVALQAGAGAGRGRVVPLVQRRVAESVDLPVTGPAKVIVQEAVRLHGGTQVQHPVKRLRTGRQGQHADVPVEAEALPGLRQLRAALPGAPGRHGPDQLEHRILRRHVRVGARRPARAVVRAEGQAQPGALLHGETHQLLPLG